MKGGNSSPSKSTAAGETLLPSENIARTTQFIDYVQAVRTLQGWPLVFRMISLSFIAWVPSVGVGYLAHLAFPDQSSPDIFKNGFQFFVGGILLAPLSETYAMRYVFRFLRRWLKGTLALAVTSALLWILPHVFYLGWGVHAAWPFFVLGICYLSLEPISFGRAMWITGLIHAACNALSYALYVALGP